MKRVLGISIFLLGLVFMASQFETTFAQLGTWTNWLDRDNASGTGDWEHKSGFSSSQLTCSNPTAIQARVVGQSTIYTPSSTNIPDSLYRFSASQGLVCRNADQSDGSCNDYEVRFFCPAAPAPLSVDVNCNGTDIEYFCNANVSGGSGSYTYNWNYNAVQNVVYAGEYGNLLELILSQSCNPNYYDTVSVTVTDTSTGQTASDWTNLACFGGGGGGW